MKITGIRTPGVNPYKQGNPVTERLKENAAKRTDQIEISKEAINMQKLQADPVRQEKIAAIKEQVENGTYEVDHKKVAVSLYNYHLKNK